jgi:hypothetical protein
MALVPPLISWKSYMKNYNCTLTFKSQGLKSKNGNKHIDQKYHERSMVLDTNAIENPWAMAVGKKKETGRVR